MREIIAALSCVVPTNDVLPLMTLQLMYASLDTSDQYYHPPRFSRSAAAVSKDLTPQWTPFLVAVVLEEPSF